MKSKSVYMSFLAGITAVSVVCAAILFSNKQQVSKLAGAETINHQIVFDKNDSVALVEPENEKGVEITKTNATRSGHSFTMKAYCYGNDCYYSFNNPEASCLLYCETIAYSADTESYVRVEFNLTNVASFTSVILNGDFFSNNDKKSGLTHSVTVSATYDKVNNKVTGRVDYYKLIVTSIELYYTCAA